MIFIGNQNPKHNVHCNRTPKHNFHSKSNSEHALCWKSKTGTWSPLEITAQHRILLQSKAQNIFVFITNQRLKSMIPIENRSPTHEFHCKSKHETWLLLKIGTQDIISIANQNLEHIFYSYSKPETHFDYNPEPEIWFSLQIGAQNMFLLAISARHKILIGNQLPKHELDWKSTPDTMSISFQKESN